LSTSSESNEEEEDEPSSTSAGRPLYESKERSSYGFGTALVPSHASGSSSGARRSEAIATSTQPSFTDPWALSGVEGDTGDTRGDGRSGWGRSSLDGGDLVGSGGHWRERKGRPSLETIPSEGTVRGHEDGTERGEELGVVEEAGKAESEDV
jgi:hypothetical protein